ncbi:methyltransferase domain-containing protein [Nannocystis pusilla]|uniref:Methyltransferase domain-containing protein n=1 Tax=Nannocystis pusilla TaxID=889268 RepID=A0A9X3EIE9_9BACT|nr:MULTISPECIES: methyltransferase domain-containing protein [Nannocystis]MCY1004714.1 methyltransferase domain-containing protein [Nannocystis pusilla]
MRTCTELQDPRLHSLHERCTGVGFGVSLRRVQSLDHYFQSTYDRVAEFYDDLWSPNVKTPNDRLTRDLHLRRGERLVDLACGSGAATLPMMRLIAPGETVAVDPSENMLRLAVERAAEEGLHLLPVRSKAEDFIADAPAHSFDVVSMRFALAYLDWPRVLPAMGRLVRPGGRVGILTSLATSAPQAMATYQKFAEHLELDTVAEPPTPREIDPVLDLLGRGGLVIDTCWQHNFRLWFKSGVDATRWLLDTGYITHPALSALEGEIKDAMIELFGSHLEDGFREDEGVPLDFFFAGVIARR